jgi:hypothetical protein
MSEHTDIRGECEFDHLPYEYEGGLTYCHFGKHLIRGAIVRLSQSEVSLVCEHCNKTIWYSPLDRTIVHDDKVCATCGTATNESDCYSSTIELKYDKKVKKVKASHPIYFCSEKCSLKHVRKIERRSKHG